MTSSNLVLVTGGTGKTGRRIIERLNTHGIPVRVGSRSTEPRFDWTIPSTWQDSLAGVHTVYIAFQPDLAVPGAVEIIRAFTAQAVAQGVKRLVLLSGRGEEEAQVCETIVKNAGVEWTIVRASWFFQNFSESFLAAAVQSGAVYLPAGDIVEPFIDADDIADVAVAAITENQHVGQVYDITGPRLMTFAQAVQEISTATGREITYTQIPPEAYVAAMEAEQTPPEVIWLVNYLFTTVLDGRNACLTDDVHRALGRQPHDFSGYVQKVAPTGVWNG